MCRSTACGECRFCHYAPITVDAAICPRCSGWAPNPGLLTQVNVGVSLVLYGIMSLICVGLVALGVLVNPSLLAFALVFAGGIFGFVRTLARPYGGPQ